MPAPDRSEDRLEFTAEQALACCHGAPFTSPEDACLASELWEWPYGGAEIPLTLALRYHSGEATYSELAEPYGWNRERVRQLVIVGTEKIRSKIEELDDARP